VIAEVTMDGTAWRAVPVAQMSLPAASINQQAFTPTSTVGYGFNTGGAKRCRLRMFNAGAGTSTTVKYKTSSLQVPSVYFGNTASPLRLTTYAGVIRSAACNAVSISGYNGTGTLAYLLVYNKASTPVPGSETTTLAWPPIPVAANSYATQSLYDARFGAGFSYAWTSDAAGATILASGSFIITGVFR
jgi:hypothetical protein